VIFDVEEANIFTSFPDGEGDLFRVFTAFFVRSEVDKWNSVSLHVRYDTNIKLHILNQIILF